MKIWTTLLSTAVLMTVTPAFAQSAHETHEALRAVQEKLCAVRTATVIRVAQYRDRGVPLSTILAIDNKDFAKATTELRYWVTMDRAIYRANLLTPAKLGRDVFDDCMDTVK
jgi:hypothetical protein